MIQQSWYQSSHLTHLLKPLSWLFRGLVFIRRFCYRNNLIQSTKLTVPVIIVGNISVGGVGKTPLVVWLAQYLQSVGFKPGIVSRGYRGQSTSWPQSVTVDSDPRQVGDEAVLLAQRADCPIVVAPDRVAAAQQLMDEHDISVILSDDGLQHYALQRDIEIAVVDGDRYFGNRQCLPAGPLREPLSRLQQVDFIVGNGVNETGWVPMQVVPGDIYNVTDPAQRLSLTACRERRWQAIAGIGHPERFFHQLETMGLTIRRHPFPDHYHFSSHDVDFGSDDFVLMTEKDAVKCRPFADERHWCLPITAQLPGDFASRLLDALNNL